MAISEGQVIKGVGGLYKVKLEDNSLIKCKARGKVKKQIGEIFIGDYVKVNTSERVIEEVKKRKSQMIRPFVSNMDGIVIILAPIPEPNFLLVDKLIYGAIEQEIDVIICINKADLDGYKELCDQVRSDYGKVASILEICAKDGKGIAELLDLIKGKFYAFAGQSAVGKSSFINVIFDREVMQTGEISRKNEKGKNTTRHVEILEVDETTKIADTCGFDKLEMPPFDPRHFASYFTDFDDYVKDCKFLNSCRHIDEKECGVKKAVEEGLISKDRYNRYRKLYEEIEKKWKNRW